MYTVIATRPDIAYAVATVSHFSINPGLTHFEAMKRIFWYLAGTKNLWLMFGGVPRELVGYANADGSMAED